MPTVVSIILSLQVFLALLAGAGIPTDPSFWTRERLGSLPLSEHAQSDHLDRDLGAKIIWDWMARDKCRPLELYICPATNQVVLTCPNPQMSTATKIGLIVGWLRTILPTIVTGYPASTPYWDRMKVRQGCTGPYLIP